MISAAVPGNEVLRLQALRKLDILDTLEEQAYDDLTKLAAAIAGTPIALVSLIDKDRQWFKSHHGLAARETPRDVAFCSHVILGDEPMVVPDARIDRRFHDNPLTLAAPDVIFYAGIPLKVDDNFNIGTLCVIDNKPRQLNQQQLEALQALARQVESQLQLRQAVRSLQQLERSKADFFAMASHELRSPLTSISGSLTLLASGQIASLPAPAMQLVKLANRNAQLLLGLVNDILDLSKIESGYLQLAMQPLSVANVAEQAVALNQGYASQAERTLELQLDDSVMAVQIQADESRLLQVLGNLLSNAVKHAAAGTQVILGVSTDKDSVHFAVRNTGAGIPAEKMDQLFVKFQQLESSGNTRAPGTGLGLVICKTLIELHGGAIAVESVPGQETCFSFSLPRLP